MERGQAARRPPVRILRRTTPGEKQGCGAAGAFLQRDPWAAASAPRPRPGPGVHPSRGEGGGSPAAGVSALAARCARCVFVWLLRAGSSLFTGESHPETQALFLSGLSQVEESIKPPDQGKGRQSGARSANQQPRGAGGDPCAADGRAAPPCARSGCAAASASRCSCPMPGPPPGGKVSRPPGGNVAALALHTATAERTSDDSR